jgi:histidine ammonia-lyase
MSKSENAVLITGDELSLEDISRVALQAAPVEIAKEAYARMESSRGVIAAVLDAGAVAYGINTGFGKLSDVQIPSAQLASLQLNLVRSHCCGVGEPLPDAEVRAMLFLRANVLAKGFSGVRPLLVDTIAAFLNAGVYPVIPSRGSVGASGDLAPLAHLALGLIGEGEVTYQGRKLPAADALAIAGISAIELQAKEGLALLNGTQAMCGVGALALLSAWRVAKLADLAGAMSLEALRGTPAAFDARIQKVRPHAGQVAAARHLVELLADSEIRESHRTNDPRVQDAYCLRCMPQVHGAVRGVLAHVADVIAIESGSATDNPLIFAAEGDILSGGNFHGAPLAFALDYAAIAMTDLISISERRIDRLINPDINEGLPPFLSDTPGLSSGFMIAHVTAAALLSEAKVLAHPASIDSVPTSGGKEDHVSMGMTAALKLRQIVANAEYVLAIELMTAAQGLDYRHPLKAALRVEDAWQVIRAAVPRLEADRVLSGDIEQLAQVIREGKLDGWMD